MATLYYISTKNLLKLDNGKESTISCQAINQYTKNIKQIKDRRAWKTEGAGAMFMGTAQAEQDDFDAIYPTAIAFMDDNTYVYSARLQEGTAIQSKPIGSDTASERLILRKSDFQVFDLCYDSTNKRIIASASDTSYASPYGERHLCVLSLDSARTQFVTEGECQDKNPSVDPNNSTVIYYDSCGLAYTQDNVVFSPRQVNRLDLATGELETVLADDKFDYFAPIMDTQGNLYAIRRPYREHDSTDPVGTAKDLLTAPFKILKAIVGWLDFFTKRYSGESLKTSGANPARTKPKSEEELFIEGNLVKADKNLLKNQADGEKFAGFIPKSWELIKCLPTGEIQIIKKGVMAYCLADDDVVISNGKSIVKITNGQEELIAHAPKVAKLMWV